MVYGPARLVVSELRLLFELLSRTARDPDMTSGHILRPALRLIGLCLISHNSWGSLRLTQANDVRMSSH